MKNTAIVILIVIVISIFSFRSFAYEMPDPSDYIPDEVKSALPDNISEDILENDAGSGISAVFSVLKDILKSLLKPAMESFSLIFGAVIISSVYSGLSSLTVSESTKKMYSYIVTLSIGMIAYKLLFDLWESSYSVICSVTALMNSMTLAMSTVYAMSGNVVSSAVSGTQTMIAITVIEDIGRFAVMPVLQLCFGLSLISCASQNININAISSFVRKAFTTLLVSVMTVMSAVMAFQGTLSRAGDSMAIRTVKLVSGHFIPVVGGFVSEALNTLAGGMGVLKSTVGIAGIAALLIMLACPVISLWLHRVAIDLCRSFCCVLSQDNQASILHDVSGLINFIIAFLCCIGVMFTINLIIFANSVSGVSA